MRRSGGVSNFLLMKKLKSKVYVSFLISLYLNVIHTFPIYISGYQPNIYGLQHLYLKNKKTNKRQNELIPYNDCLYRNMYRYKYIALLDIDEVILPIEEDNWSDLMKKVKELAYKIKKEERASYNFRNVYFLDEMLTAHEKVITFIYDLLTANIGKEQISVLRQVASH